VLIIAVFKEDPNPAIKEFLSFVLNILLTQYYAGGKIETNEMGRACGAYGGG